MASKKDNFTKHPAKFLSIFVERMVPDYVQAEHPMFITFVRKYFEYLERETGVNGELGEFNQITDLIQNIDVDHALDQFIPEFEKQYLHGTPHSAVDPTVSTTDKSFLSKNVQPVYRQKGTTSALDFLFRRDFDEDVETMYPKEWIWKASGSVWYEPQWITILTDKAAAEVGGEYEGATVNVQTADTVRSIYNKKIIGQVSGATAFVDMDESIFTTDYEKLLLTEVNGVFIKDEQIWEDVGTQLNVVPYVAIIISEGIRTEGECIVNGHRWTDKWMHISGHPNEVPLVAPRITITGLTSGATAQISGFDVDYTKLNLLEVDGDFQLGEKIVNSDGFYWNPTPTESFCTTSTDWSVLGTFDNMIDCLAALHPDGWDKGSPYYGESAFLDWYPLLEVTTVLQDVENNILNGISTPPTTKEHCEALVDESQPLVDTAVWKTNGYWIDSAGFLSSDRKLQDNDYYQDFSYVIKSEVPIEAYREVLKKLVHPVGLKLFAEFSFRSSVDLKVEMPQDYVKLIVAIFSYLDVAIDIWDQESEQHGTLGHAHTGFSVHLEKALDEYIIEVMSRLDNKSTLITPNNWNAPGEHFGVDIQSEDPLEGGAFLKEKLMTVCSPLTFIPEEEYAKEKSYGHFEANRENTIVHKVYGVANDVIDSVEIQAFEAEDVIHSHGRKNGFAPLVQISVTKGLTNPTETQISSSGGWHYNVGTSTWEPYDNW